MRNDTWIPFTAITISALQRLSVFSLLVVATVFGAAAQTPPSAPVIGVALPGNGLATINFTPPSANGGAPIIGYTATCLSGATSSPAIGGNGIGVDFSNTIQAATSTNSFTSTGGGIILASVGRGDFNDFARATVSDNKANGNYGQVGSSHRYTNYTGSGTSLYAKTAAAGGAGHIVNTTKPTPGDEVTIVAAEFKNVDTIVDSQWSEVANFPVPVPITSASVTTTGPAILGAFWWGDDSLGNLSMSVSSGWAVLNNTSSLASSHVQTASAYRVVSAAGTYSITWSPSTPQGGQLWIVAMQQLGGGATTSVSASGLASPIIVKGLTNDVSATCTVVARNSLGVGAASSGVSVTPSASTPFAFVSAQSRKTHGSAGTFDLLIDTQPVNGQVTVEPRAIGNGHTIAYQFNGPVSAAGNAGVTPLGSATATSVDNEVIVTLTNVPDNQRATVTLGNVNGSLFNAPSLSLGFLIGDVNNTRSVNSSDISAVKARSGQTTDGSNFKFDLNFSGGVNSSDISAVKARSGLTLP